MAEMQAQWDVANGGGGSANANRRGSTKGYELSEIVVHSSGAEEVVKQLPSQGSGQRRRSELLVVTYDCTFPKESLGIMVKDDEGPMGDRIVIVKMNQDVRAATNIRLGDEVTAINGISCVGVGVDGFKAKVAENPERPIRLTFKQLDSRSLSLSSEEPMSPMSPRAYGIGRGEVVCSYECAFQKPSLGIQVKDGEGGHILITQLNPDVRAATRARVGDEVTAINGISLVGKGVTGFKEKLKETPARPLVLTVQGVRNAGAGLPHDSQTRTSFDGGERALERNSF
mmetsp:Transcript_19354/g.40464  ORF Transcript_19354/g.40464 Transcript_19354/m.40464 type:complete len:285 (-) Transcript_19354:77-931(-)|eukprot:CAMPEP_0182547936 /NCGR_PEP_ID=MMETSP1323-20130603/38131_1 /TAXON_ID=236787 /ORGANISM="Florenciella parvula, Strain RCC1693" /LENGTH=284 /DNA_ID=CAMNT_0024759287 /DNA_START=90 /DNA_END=944 /DNA_ORIENTATION=+